MPGCCHAASIALSLPLLPPCLPAILLRFCRFPLSAAAILPPLPSSTAVAALPLSCLCHAGSAALPLYRCSAAAALLLTPPCCHRTPAATLPPCSCLCVAAATLVQTLPLPCYLCPHCSATASNTNALPPCRHDHVLMFCTEHASHLHLSNLPIHLFYMADSKTIQNQHSVCRSLPPPFSLCHPSRVHPSFSSSRAAFWKVTYLQTHRFFAICLKVILFIMKNLKGLISFYRRKD